MMMRKKTWKKGKEGVKRKKGEAVKDKASVLEVIYNVRFLRSGEGCLRPDRFSSFPFFNFVTFCLGLR